ncbi:MAG TPA: nitroreductase family protein [Candidatus Eisenbergiella intestinipullorum]|nr:nitroreductase family protein [Candidatus Eisenbergiella intestinipullorum]
MNTSEAIRSRRSIRKYEKGFLIPQEHIEQMLEAAMMAPSACNRRPWEFVVVQKPEVLEQIMNVHPYTRMLETASLAIVVCGRPDLQEGICDGFWPQDCGAAIENLLLQATELGYGTCWCGCYPARNRAEELQKVLDVTSIPLAVVAVGKADEAPDARGFYDPSRVKWVR